MRKKVLSLCLALVTTAFAWAQDADHHHFNSNITPFNDAAEYMSGITSVSHNQKNEWKAFVSKHNDWGARFSNYTQLPHRAFGTPFAYNVGGNDLVAKTIHFFKNELAQYNIPVDELVLTRNNNDGIYQHVDFKQIHEGREVMWTRAGIRYSQDNKIILFITDVYRNIPTLKSSIVPSQAVSIAENAIQTDIISTNVSPEMKILPLPKNGNTEFRLVYEVVVNTQDDAVTPGEYYTYVDANSGEILYRDNKVVNLAFNINADIFPLNSFSTKINKPMPYMRVTYNNTNYFTDVNGNVTIPGAGPINPTISLRGTYCRIYTGANGNTTPTFTPLGVANNDQILLTPTAAATERHLNAFYHVGIVHDFMKERLPNFTGLDVELTTRIDRTDGNCNAFYNGTSINFYTTANSCNALSYIADVVYHEYGHGITNRFWQQMGATFNNGAVGEGYSDVWAMSIINSPIIGKGFYVNQPNSFIRRYDVNPKIYPQNIVGEVHADGEIIAGAWYDYHVNLSASMPQATALDSMCRLFARSHNGLAVGPNGTEGQVYYDILIDALTYDDNNNNINDGTPHFMDIVKAFAAHGIYLLMNSEVNHNDIGPVDAGIPITIDASVLADFPSFVGDVKMYYRKKGVAATFDSTILTKVGNVYTVNFPTGAMGDVYEYYFGMYDNLGYFGTLGPKESKFTILANQRNLPYFLAIGYHMAYLQDFENVTAQTPNWTIGNAPDDNATAGLWLVDLPIGSSTGGKLVQTDKDHTTGSGKCAITGNAANAGAQIGSADVDGGRTTIITDELDLSSYTSPIISYFRWFSNSQGTNPRKDWWRAYASYNNGASWFLIERTFQPDVSWRRQVFVPDLSQSTKVRLMFVATDSAQGQATGSIVEAALDDIAILTLGNAPSKINDLKELQTAVYPNPATNNIVIQTSERGNMKYTLTNIVGNKILQSEANTDTNGKVPVSVKGIISGVYFLHVECNGKKSVHKLNIANF